jgi:hypothetical protein
VKIGSECVKLKISPARSRYEGTDCVKQQAGKGLEQWFSAFVRPRPSKFSFYKKRARYN